MEFRPDDPYSVELNYFVKDGRLYIDPAEGRTWLEYLRADPRVRVRFGDPEASHAPVGDPPITRWEYSGFIVYFEYDKVIHAVRKR